MNENNDASTLHQEHSADIIVLGIASLETLGNPMGNPEFIGREPAPGISDE